MPSKLCSKDWVERCKTREDWENWFCAIARSVVAEDNFSEKRLCSKVLAADSKVWAVFSILLKALVIEFSMVLSRHP